MEKLPTQAGPKVSIRPARPATTPDDDFRTRPLPDTEIDEMRGRAPDARPRREIHIAARGAEGELGRTEFELVDELGAGGMGTVFRARQLSLDREVALKQLTDTESMPDAVAHFESEACITAVLEHPSIVPVYDMGASNSGDVFYGMKLIEGDAWDQLLAKRSPGTVGKAPGSKYDLRAHLEVLIEVSNAVAYAHSRGIIHRDIKPQNVMVGDYGEVLLVDWGLACALNPMPSAPRIFDLGQVLVTCGTPAYMPPEISTGAREWVGKWTDVYMLGAVLFEVLYGLPPHEENTAIDALRVASKNEWRFPDSIPPQLRPFHDLLEPVVSKALSTHPKDRHPNGRAFAEAVQAALEHLDAAELGAEAIEDFSRIEAQHAQVQSTRKRRGDTPGTDHDRQDQYRTLGRVIAVLEQSLSSWGDNPAAQHYIVEAQLLHILIAIENNELSLARSQLEALDHLPDVVRPNPDQSKRAHTLKRRLSAKVDSRKRRSRRTAAVWIGAGVLAFALLVGSVIAALMIRGARDRARVERNQLSRLLIGVASDGIQSEMTGLLQPVRGSLLAATDWARAGRLDTDDPAALSSFFVPLADRFPVISSVIRADDQGGEYMLLRTEEGWQVRMTTPGEPSTFHALDSGGRITRTWTETLDYDPHSRPWYQGATALEPNVGDDAVFWTEPYIFYSAQQPGLTAAVATKSPGGRTFVLGVDMLLTDLSEFTMRMTQSEGRHEHGKVFVIDEASRVVGLPGDDAFATEAARREAVLTPLPELGEPISAAALAAWRAQGSTFGQPFRFEAEGQAWWSGFRAFELSSTRQLLIGVALPETDFADGEP